MPKSWGAGDGPYRFLRLTRDDAPRSRPGWCVYPSGFDATPEVEVICGGRNSKKPSAAAIWRQGNLLHFGFEPDPSAYNEVGRALLTNAIVYASRFGDDRPLFREKSPFKSKGRGRRPITPDFVGQWRDKFNVKMIDYWFEPELLAAVPRDDAEIFWAWFDANRPFLRTTEAGKLAFDEEARALGAKPRAASFFADTIAMLDRGDRARAQKLLARYAPEGAPKSEAGAEIWSTWWRDNGPYLYWSESDGHRWALDRLAKRRGIPTGECRGPKRAGPYPLPR